MIQMDLPYIREAENINGITILDNGGFNNVTWLIENNKVLVNAYESIDEVECELANTCDNDCHRCAGNFNTRIKRVEISPIHGKFKICFEAYSGDCIGDCYSNMYFVGIYNSKGEKI